MPWFPGGSISFRVAMVSIRATVLFATSQSEVASHNGPDRPGGCTQKLPWMLQWPEQSGQHEDCGCASICKVVDESAAGADTNIKVALNVGWCLSAG